MKGSDVIHVLEEQLDHENDISGILLADEHD
jgi:hypothetical protein